MMTEVADGRVVAPRVAAGRTCSVFPSELLQYFVRFWFVSDMCRHFLQTVVICLT
jgi:hypothetical protein